MDHARQQPAFFHDIVRLARELARCRRGLDDDPLRDAVLDCRPRPPDCRERALADNVIVRYRLDVRSGWRQA
jgi:hypothetical protein